MTDTGPAGHPPFDIRELDGTGGSAEDLVETTRMARELEVVADRSGAAPSTAFTERVMSAVASEPVPAPVQAAGIALRAGAIGTFLASLRDAWRVATHGGFPVAVRAQALAFVLVVVGIASGTGLAAAGAAGLLGGEHTTPTPPPAITPLPTVGPASPEPESSVTPEPSESVEPSREPSSEPTDTAEPTDTPDGEGGGAETPTVKPTKAPATHTPTPAPTRTHEPEDDGGGSTDAPETQDPESTNQPESTQQPGETDDPQGTPESGSAG